MKYLCFLYVKSINIYLPIPALFSLFICMVCSSILENTLYFPVNILASRLLNLSFLIQGK